MSSISNFSSVFEVAFAINALLYVFQIRPFDEEAKKRRRKVFKKTRQKMIAEYGYDVPDAKLLVETMKSFDKWHLKFVSKFTILNSLFALALLLIGGFFPELTVSPTVIGIILFLLFVPTGIIYAIAGGLLDRTRLFNNEEIVAELWRNHEINNTDSENSHNK